MTEEHAEVKKLVSQADTVKVTDPNYDQIISKAVNTFLEHADEEESDQFKLILKAVSSEENDVWSPQILSRDCVLNESGHQWLYIVSLIIILTATRPCSCV